MKPAFVTFTGVDKGTDLARVESISRQWPVEWGVLFSPDRQGLEPRYPAMDVVDRIRTIRAAKAAHLCGAHAKAIMAGSWANADFTGFGRIQVNHRSPDPETIAEFASRHGISAIAQTRGETYPKSDAVAWLFDCSGGIGRLPNAWPKHPGDRLVGYAGGISPDTIAEVLNAVDDSGPYWLDMETGVRTDDMLDLDKCEAVLRAVYG